jgi:hypothetical protein
MREIITINGVSYDAKTGLPAEPDKPKLDSPAPTPKPKPKKIAVRSPKKIVVNSAAKPARAARRPAASQTLNRRFVAKPPAAKPARPTPPSKPLAKPIAAPKLKPTISVRPSPVVPRGVRRPSPPPAPSKPAEPEISAEEKRSVKVVSLVVAGIIVVLAALATLAYLFVPAVSFWVASTHAEVSASMPTYAPAGFKVQGRAESSPGVITLNYQSPANSYSITMANSNWDSDGVLENKVKPTSTNYQTLNQKGLTIFVQKDKALWVNGGILYTLTFQAELPNSEILKIVDGI